MKKIYFAAIAAMIFTSCEKDAFTGTEDVKQQNSKPQPVERVEYENLDYVLNLDTNTGLLYTVEQAISGDIVNYNNDVEEARKSFKEALDLNVKFSAMPSMVYVDNVEALSKVSLTDSSANGELYDNEEKSNNGFTRQNVTREFNFTFDQGEKVNAQAAWQILSVDNRTFTYADVKNVSYNSFEATLNEEKTNADSTVYNVVLKFDVEVRCVKENKHNKIYTVEVPTVRIYKNGEKPDTWETKLENEAYEAKFDTATMELFTVFQENSGDIATYKNGEEYSRESWVRGINLEALFNVDEIVYVESEAELTNISIIGSSHSGDAIDRNVDGSFTTTTRSLNYNFSLNAGEQVKTATEYESLTYEEEAFEYHSIQNVSFNCFETSANTKASTETLKVVDVVLYFDVKVQHEKPAQTRAAAETETYTVAVPYKRALKVEAPKDELTGKRADDVVRRVIDANTEEISWTEVETWSVSGEKSTPMSFKLYRHFTAPAMQWVYTVNNQYNTTGNGEKILREEASKQDNWTVTTRYMQYTSTANNGNKAFNNVYAYDLQKAVYDNGYYTLSFDYAEWIINEAGSNVSTSSTEVEKNGVVYNVFNYVNNINTVYSIDSYKASAKAEAKIAIEKPVEKIIPENWGKIIGAGISAVPSDDESGNFAKKCLTIRTDKGAVAVVFDYNSNICSVNNILNGYFIEGSFGAEYNSGYFTTSTNKGSYAAGKWAPAIAKDLDSRIAYYKGNTCVRNVKNTTLAMWNWRGGNYSTVVDGYTFNVTSDGILTVTLNGKKIITLR